MIQIDVPGLPPLRLAHLVVDVNGTIARDGQLIEGVVERLREVQKRIDAVAITADTHGTAVLLAKKAGMAVRVVERGHEGQQKLGAVLELGAEHVIAVGNGANDAEMLAAAALGVCVIGPEGAASRALAASDVVVSSILDALDLLLLPTRLLATLRC